MTTDKLTEAAKSGQWSLYEKRLNRLWNKYYKEHPDGRYTTAMEFFGLTPPYIDPDLWQAVILKVDSRTQFQATIRELLKMWVAGQVDPWGDAQP